MRFLKRSFVAPLCGLLAASALLQVQSASADIHDFQMKGWATVGSGTTGGAGGDTVSVSSPSGFVEAIGRSGPLIIEVVGTIDLGNLSTRHPDYSSNGRYHVTSDKTIAGRGSDAHITRGELRLSGKTNVIIRNIKFSKSPDTAIAISGGTTHVWVDHNDLSDSYDGLLDISTGSDLITVSWNHFSNHSKTSLVGSSDGQTGDRNRLRVTYHHNWFHDTVQRHPRVRYGRVHVYNNYFTNNSSYAIGIGVEAQIVSESNYIDGAKAAWRLYDSSSQPGYFKDTGSILKNIYYDLPSTSSKGIDWSPLNEYAYTLTPASDVPAIVQSAAGVGVINPLDSSQEPTPEPEPVEPRTPVGLIAHYPLSEETGDVANDQSGFGEALPLSLSGGATWISGGGVALTGGTANLTSAGSAAKIANQIAGTGEFSVEVWAKPHHLDQPDTGTHPSRIVTMSQDNSNRNFMLGHGGEGYQGPELAVRTRTTGAEDDANGMPNIVATDTILDTRTHYVVTFDGTMVRIYRDGQLKHSESREGELTNWNPGYYLVLGNEIGSDRGWVGDLHEVAIYDVALTETQILENYAAAPPAQSAATATTFTEWMDLVYPTMDPSGSELSDPEGDGISNILHYALASNPKDTMPDRTQQVTLQTNPSTGEDHLTITYNRRSIATDTEIVVEVSANNQNWIPLGSDAIIEVIPDENFETVVVQDSIPISESGRRFMRIRVTLLNLG